MNISVRDLRFTYPNGVTALAGVSLEISSGERVAVIGQNGSGKTTLAKHLNGLLRPSSGQVVIGDWDTRTHTAAQLSRRVGFLFQNPEEQIFRNRVEAEVAFGLQLLRIPREQVERRVEAALVRVGLAEARAAHPYELHPSQRRWVALASILALDTPALILDEPTTGQDARGLDRLGQLIEELAHQGKTLIVVTHDVDFCAEQFDRVVVMKKGRVLMEGDPHSVFSQPGLLAESFVEPPQITRLGLALGLSQPVTTVDEFVALLRARSLRASE